MDDLKAPFPWFGGKSRVASQVWARFGKVDNYVEPFAGSLAVLLGAPEPAKIETVNDLDGMVANFWRAMVHAPEDLAKHADWPVNENDLTARHIRLVELLPEMQTRLEGDPECYDAKVAGWWVWGISSWIGSGWCSGDGPWTSVDGKLAKDAGRGVNRQRPHLGNAGMGVHRGDEVWPHIEALAQRLRRVRVCCGDWARVTGPSVTVKNGLTAVFLDPPYGATRTSDLYATDCAEVHHRVRAWCEANGGNPSLRIALCGYEGEHDTLTELGWDEVSWKAPGGYAHAKDAIENAARERIWYSPHCLSATQMSLFSGAA